MNILLIDDEAVALNALKRRMDWAKYGFEEVFTAYFHAPGPAAFRAEAH